MDTKSNTKIGFSAYILTDNQKNRLEERRGRDLPKFAKNRVVKVKALKFRHKD